MERRLPWLAALLLSLLVAGGCSKVEDATDDNGSENGDGGARSGDGDGDGDGDSSSGDGDGDSSSGDGDAPAGDGDGDGDAPAGDGDGDGDAPSGDVVDAGMFADGGVPCGGTYCAPDGCCADPFASICGAPLGERACIMPPPRDSTSDDRCPELSIMGFFSLPSCCTDNNECGINASMFGAGCIENSRFEMLAMQMAGGSTGNTEFPPSQACE